MGLVGQRYLSWISLLGDTFDDLVSEDNLGLQVPPLLPRGKLVRARTLWSEVAEIDESIGDKVLGDTFDNLVAEDNLGLQLPPLLLRGKFGLGIVKVGGVGDYPGGSGLVDEQVVERDEDKGDRGLATGGKKNLIVESIDPILRMFLFWVEEALHWTHLLRECLVEGPQGWLLNLMVCLIWSLFTILVTVLVQTVFLYLLQVHQVQMGH